MVEQKHPHRDDDHPRHAGRDRHLGHHHDHHGGVGHFHRGGRGHVRAPASFGKAFAISLDTARVVAEGGVCGYFGNSTGHVQETSGRVAESKRITIGWLKMAVEAKRAVVPVGIAFWRLMTPKSYFAVDHGANALTLVDFACIYLVP
jgi:hypothetical protein